MSSWIHPDFANDFTHELRFAREREPAVRATAHPGFVWIDHHRAEHLLLRNLNEFAPLVAVPGLSNKPMSFISQPPSPGNCVGLVIGTDDNGKLACRGTNRMLKPTKAAGNCPEQFFSKFDAAQTEEERVWLLHGVISLAASNGNADWVTRVDREGNRYGILPIYLVVLADGMAHFYATTALVDGWPQCDMKREKTGGLP